MSSVKQDDWRPTRNEAALHSTVICCCCSFKVCSRCSLNTRLPVTFIYLDNVSFEFMSPYQQITTHSIARLLTQWPTIQIQMHKSTIWSNPCSSCMNKAYWFWSTAWLVVFLHVKQHIFDPDAVLLLNHESLRSTSFDILVVSNQSLWVWAFTTPCPSTVIAFTSLSEIKTDPHRSIIVVLVAHGPYNLKIWSLDWGLIYSRTCSRTTSNNWQ